MLRSPILGFGTHAPPTPLRARCRKQDRSFRHRSPLHAAGSRDASCASPPPEFQFSTPEHQFVAIFQFVQLVAAETAATCDISTVDASEIAHKIVSTLLNN